MSTLERFAAGDLRGWTGLPRGLTRETVAAALGEAVPPRDLGGRFAGEARVLRHHAPTQAAPAGVNVWFGSGGAVAVEYAPARLPEPPGDQLGEPEAVIDAGLTRRLVHASRGLAVDVAPDGTVERVVGFIPCAVDAFLAGPLARNR